MYKVSLIFSFLFLTISSNLYAQWPALSTPNVAVSTSSGNEHNYWACTDDKDGSIIVWEDDRAADNDIYVQRINNLGVLQWTGTGVKIAVVPGHNHGPMVIENGTGGAVMAWRDERGASKDIYAQAVDSNGVVLWTVNGVAICTEGSEQEKVFIVSDGAGGAIIAWEDKRSGKLDVYAQRVGFDGSISWPVNGISISSAIEDQDEITMVADGSGGAIIAWTDKRSGNEDVYAQRVNSAGVVQYAVDGIPIVSLGDEQQNPFITSDGFGNFVLAWEDERGGSDEDIYSQKINLTGAIQWPVNGVAVTVAVNEQTDVTIVKDGLGGVFYSWIDERGAAEDIYAQRSNASGSMQWTANGVVVCSATDEQKEVHMADANTGKALLIWQDKRGGDEDLYVQLLDSNGTGELGPDGLAASTATDTQKKPFIFKVGSGDWIAVWGDERSGNKDLYAQGFNKFVVAALPITLISFDAEIDNTAVKLIWSTSAEINNDYFTVERSQNGLDFENIAEISGSGNSSIIIDYEQYDDSPLLGTSYYRLKQTDFDGKFEYVGILAVNFNQDDDGICTLHVYPNPCVGSCTIDLKDCPLADNQIDVELYDAFGKKIVNRITPKSKDQDISFHLNSANNLAPGVYIVRSTTNGKNQASKVIVK